MRHLARCCALTALAAAPIAAQVVPPPAATRAEFEAVCQRLRKTSYFFNDFVADALRERLAEPGLDPFTEAQLQGALGWELTRLGEHEAAIEALERGRALLAGLTAPGAPELAERITLQLAITHLQLGEDLNCVGLHHPRSCILPIAPEAVHELPEHVRAASALLREHLARSPGDLHARWLLNLAAMITGDPASVPTELRLPPAALVSEAPFPEWPEIAAGLGVAAFDLAGGAVMDDFDGDGLLDLVSSTSDPCGPMKAYRSDGRGGFEDVAAAWGLDAQLGGLNLLQADYDGDGHLDLLVLRGAWLGELGMIRNSLLRNDLHGETGRFVDATFAAGLAYPAYPTQTAAWGDYDGDHDLDLYIGNEAPLYTPARGGYGSPTGAPYPSQLFRNDGDGTFTDVARAAGVLNGRMAKGVAWGDHDDDGDLDLYVSNYGPNRLYRNQGDGTFVDVAEEAGVLEPQGRSFATWFFDYDNDGDLDLFVASYDATYPTVARSYFGERAPGAPVLYRNDGGRFRDVASEAGIDRQTLPMGANFGDLDNDGFPDFYLGTGSPELDSLMPNLMYRNDGGRRFQDVTFAGGFGHLQKGHGVAFGDLDNDGDQDLFHQLGGAFPSDAYWNALFENPGSPHHWITLRLRGAGANAFGIGARIELRVRDADGTIRSIHALAGSGGSFGASSLQQEIGLGPATAIAEVRIRWPGQPAPTVYPGPALDGVYQVAEGAPELVPVELPRLVLGDGTPPPAHAHATGR